MTVESLRNREKFITLDRFLKDDHALLHVITGAAISDRRSEIPGLDLPQHLRAQATVTLKVSRNFRGAMRIDERRGVTADLLFNNEYYTCVVPFDAVWGMTSASGQMRMWPEDTPEEILNGIAAVTRGRTQEEPVGGHQQESPSDGDGSRLEGAKNGPNRAALERVGPKKLAVQDGVAGSPTDEPNEVLGTDAPSEPLSSTKVDRPKSPRPFLRRVK